MNIHKTKWIKSVNFFFSLMVTLHRIQKNENSKTQWTLRHHHETLWTMWTICSLVQFGPLPPKGSVRGQGHFFYCSFYFFPKPKTKKKNDEWVYIFIDKKKFNRRNGIIFVYNQQIFIKKTNNTKWCWSFWFGFYRRQRRK